MARELLGDEARAMASEIKNAANTLAGSAPGLINGFFDTLNTYWKTPEGRTFSSSAGLRMNGLVHQFIDAMNENANTIVSNANSVLADHNAPTISVGGDASFSSTTNQVDSCIGGVAENIMVPEEGEVQEMESKLTEYINALQDALNAVNRAVSGHQAAFNRYGSETLMSTFDSIATNTNNVYNEVQESFAENLNKVGAKGASEEASLKVSFGG